MVFRKKTDKGSVHENEQAQYGHSEPYMNMPYGGAYPNKEMPFRPSTSREVTGPIYDPRQREMPQGYQRPAQPPHGNGMYGPMY
ncbi:MAG: hypothetical protein Q8K36_02010, partial [Alphaproteobacteria bacterium]|nr:hypothetical protein [Alphaproteobacteria bacterium]